MRPYPYRHALITGGASGLGRLMALGLTARGTAVTVWDRDPAGLEALKAEVYQKAAPGSGSLEAHQADITDQARVSALAAVAQASAAGPVDLLIHNAGVVSGRSLLDTSPDQIRRTFEVNTLAPFWTAQAFLPAMKAAGRGRIVTIASAAGLVGVKGLADYSASKFAAVGFDEALRMELKGTGVRTLVVCPFFIDTGMFAGVQTRFPLLLPILKPEFVVKKILAAAAGRRAKLVLPWFVHTVGWLRIFPVAVFDALASFFGVNAAMDHFTGRPGGSR